MIANKEDFIKKYLPESVKSIDMTTVNLDITDLSLTDILRNLNKLYPPNSRSRLAVEGGEKVLGVKCISDSLEPYSGVFLIIGNKDLDVEVVSCDHIVLYISETRIKSETLLETLMLDITDFLIHNYSKSMRNLPDFYKKYVYNEAELYDDDDYVSSDY